jgi:DNA-binding NarL/FixJ family response regulator
VTGLLVISIIALGLTLVIISQHRGFLESYRQELLHALQESQAVKSDLENLLNQAIQLSDQITAKLEYQAMDRSSNAVSSNSDNRRHYSDTVSNAGEHNQYADDQNYKQPHENDSELPLYYHQVLALQQQGYAIRDIASKLNLGQGEVSLILNITKKRRVV